jgi:transcriptional regulator with XRE-family HTH domain
MKGKDRMSGVDDFATALRLHRKRRAMSQEDLSAATRGGVAVRTISDLERGVARQPRSHTLRLLAEALGLAGEELAAFTAAARPARSAEAAAAAAELKARARRGRAGGRGGIGDRRDTGGEAGQAAAGDRAEAAAGSAVLAAAQPGLQVPARLMAAAPVIIMTGAVGLAQADPALAGAACLVLVLGG